LGHRLQPGQVPGSDVKISRGVYAQSADLPRVCLLAGAGIVVVGAVSALRAQPLETISVSASPVFFGITKWLTWAVRPVRTEAGQAQEAAVSLLAVVSRQRLMELVPLLDATGEGGADLEVHHLLRFNLLNLGGDPATVCAIALRGKGEVLRCEVVPSVVVRAAPGYPFALEVRTGLVSEAVDIQVESLAIPPRPPQESQPAHGATPT
jgi:hypothetical protein